MASDIVEDGDTVLIVGSNEVRLHVHSIVMTMVSKPFRALLGPNFKEGQQPKTLGYQLKEIELPEDDAVAMKVVCKVLHHQGDMVDATLSPTILLNVAILADKYDSIAAVRAYGNIWLLSNLKLEETKIIVKIVAAAYIFQNSLGFKKMTRSLVHYHIGPYYGILDEQSRLVLPMDFLSLLEQHRANLYLRVTEALSKCADSFGTTAHCDWAEAARSSFRRGLQNIKLNPKAISQRSIASALKAARNFTASYQPPSRCSGSDCDAHFEMDYAAVMHKEANEIDEDFKGLSLDFFKGKS